MCRSVLEGTGKCHFIFPDKDKCEFAHSREEMEMWANWRKKRWGKRTMCKNVATCKYDSSCRFSHTEEECKWWNQSGPMKDNKPKWSVTHPLRPPSPPAHLLLPPRSSPPTTMVTRIASSSPPTVAPVPSTPLVSSKQVMTSPVSANSNLMKQPRAQPPPPSPMIKSQPSLPSPPQVQSPQQQQSFRTIKPVVAASPPVAVPVAPKTDFSMFYGDSATWHLPPVFAAPPPNAPAPPTTATIASTTTAAAHDGYNVMDQFALKNDFPCDWLREQEVKKLGGTGASSMDGMNSSRSSSTTTPIPGSPLIGSRLVNYQQSPKLV